MNSSELKDKCIEILQSKKALDIKVIDVKDISSISDYFVVATGTSSTHIMALADEIEVKLKEIGIKPNHKEGYRTSCWVLIDYGDVVVHIFSDAERKFYGLEDFWVRQINA